MIFGKIKAIIILEMYKIQRMTRNISKVVQEEINLIVILIKLNHNIMMKSIYKKKQMTTLINKNKSKKKKDNN